jgi:regulator of protease activity HflC (stomatin/prohibitin superfamily)
METTAVAVVVIGLSSLVIASGVAACIRTVPDGSVDLVRRYGRDIGERRPGRYVAIPLIDGSVTVPVAPFSREVSRRAFTVDRLDVFVRARVYFFAFDTSRFAPRRRVFDDKHEAIVEAAICEVVGALEHDHVVVSREEVASAILQRVADEVAGFGLGVTRVELEEVNPSHTGVPAERVVGATPPLVFDPVESLTLAIRAREARLAPPTPTPLRPAVVGSDRFAGADEDDLWGRVA